MHYLTPSQLKQLKTIRNAGIYDCSTISNDKLKTIKYLRSEGFLDVDANYTVYPTETGTIKSAETSIRSVQISEAGKAYLQNSPLIE